MSVISEEVRRTRDPYRLVRNEVRPNPIMVADHGRSVEMRPITQRMRITNDDDIVIVGDR